MGFDWEQLLGTTGGGLADVYEEQSSDSLFQDRPTVAPPGAPFDQGSESVFLPFQEI